jgi:hypothetical protein
VKVKRVSRESKASLIFMLSEVENLIRDSVRDVVLNVSKLLPQRDALADELLKVLENDASWVELYGITGELIMPPLDKSQAEERQECLDLVKQVPPYTIRGFVLAVIIADRGCERRHKHQYHLANGIKS